MNKLQSRISAALLVLFILIIVFHTLVLAKLIPSEIVWGGKLESTENLQVFEVVSILLNGVFSIVLVFYRRRHVGTKIPVALRISLWAMFGLFTLNTVGNLLAETLFEQLVFTPLTALVAIGLWILLKKQQVPAR